MVSGTFGSVYIILVVLCPLLPLQESQCLNILASKFWSQVLLVGFGVMGERRVFKHSALWLLFQTVFLVVSRALYQPVSVLSVIGKTGYVTC